MDLEKLVKINKDFFIQSSTVALKAQLVGLFPFIAIQPWAFVYDKFSNWLINKLADGLELVAFFKYIDTRTDQQGRDYVKAIENLESAKTLNNKDQIKNAELTAREAFKKLIKFTN